MIAFKRKRLDLINPIDIQDAMHVKEADVQSLACGATNKVWYMIKSFLIKPIDIQDAMHVKEAGVKSLACGATNKVWYMIILINSCSDKLKYM